MSLLPLAPSVVKLRRTAKAFAAGELSRFEYRTARRRVIEEFGEGRDVSDDTRPRFDPDVTQRRTVTTMTVEEPAMSRGWAWWIVLCTLVLVALVIPAIATAAVAVEIPAVADRDPNPVTSTRLDVETLRLSQTLAAESDLDAQTLVEVETFLHAQLAAAKSANKPGPHGFNDAELQEVARFLDAIGIHESQTRLTGADLRDLSALVAAQKNRRGVSVVQLERIAAQLQAWIRQKGYPVAAVYVPHQIVESATVELGLQIGKLTSLVVQGASQQAVDLRMGGLLGKTVERDKLETQLNALNRGQGTQVSASFAPGANVGESELRLKVNSQKNWSAYAQVDNYGPEVVGEERASFGGSWLNLRGLGDSLQVDALTTISPSDQQFVQARYATPIMRGQKDLAVRLALGDVDTDLSGGDGVLLDVDLRNTLLFTRTQRKEISYGIGIHDLGWDGGFDQQARFVNVGYNGHRLWDDTTTALEGDVRLTLGQVDTERPGQDKNWWRLHTQARIWRPVDFLKRLPLGQSPKVVVHLQGQLSNDDLPSTQKLFGGGPDLNRAFTRAAVSVDRGLSIGVQLGYNLSLGRWWMFADSLYGDTRGATESWVHLTSIGVGWEAQLLENSAGRLMTRLSLAQPVTHKVASPHGIAGSTQALNPGFDTQFYWSLKYVH